MNQINWSQVANQITESAGERFIVKSASQVGGGCINQAWKIKDDKNIWFIKVNDISRQPMFAAEMSCLKAIANTKTIKVPAALCVGKTSHHSYLVLEYLKLDAHSLDGSEALGEQLAGLHRHTSDQFGWQNDNNIGTTKQINTATSDWIKFWREHRLGFQLKLAADNGYKGRLQRQGEQLLQRLDQIMLNHSPPASLLHGDLWSGNYAITSSGQPAIFDPASYYGDRETDLAMTELFGGFSSRFYQAYEATWPLPEGYQHRTGLYNLYHILNHLNLFGGSYLGQAESMLDALIVNTV